MKICYLYPDILNVNGSRGNVVCLRERARARGADVSITEAPLGWDGRFKDYDLIYIGAGHGEPDAALLSDLRRIAGELQAFAENGGVILAVCEGFDLLCRSLTLSDGSERQGAGVLNASAVYGSARDTGNFVFDCGGDIGNVAAFKNTAVSVTPGEGVSPLGLCKNGEGEGARYKNVFCSHGHGPLLPKNPALADAILAAAGLETTPLDDELETLAHDYMEKKLS